MRTPHKGELNELGLWGCSVGDRPYTVRVREKEIGEPVSVFYSEPRSRRERSLGYAVRDHRGRFVREAIDEAVEAAHRVCAELRLGLPINDPPSAADGISDGAARTDAMRRARSAYIDDQARRCTVCGWQAPQLPRNKIAGLQVHHIIPVAVGGSHDLSNLILLCANCHSVAHALWGHRHGPDRRVDFIIELGTAIRGCWQHRGRGIDP